MTETLLIVESPAKAKKIQSLLPPGQYLVKASVGHVRDLPAKALGVDLETYDATYVVSEGKDKVVSQLRSLAKTRPVLLGTDLDREGEAIAWHLKELLELKDAKKVDYTEITKEALTKALASPRPINMALVSAQEARRVLDRLIGYLVSPALSEKAGITLSAGRVQSVAVKMVVERERAIRKFKPQRHYGITFHPNKAPGLTCELLLKDWSEDGKHLFDINLAKALCGNTKARLMAIQKKRVSVKQRPPFITVSMQEAAAKRYGMRSSASMKAAQGLFDVGAITYHRTDNPNLSVEGFQKIVKYLHEKKLPAAVEQPQFAAKGDAQEAHEAIRPTDIALEATGSNPDEQRIYELIRERAMLSAMPPGVDDQSQLLFVTHSKYEQPSGKMKQAQFAARGKIVHEMGWRDYAVIEPISAEDTPLPVLNKGEDYEGKITRKNKDTRAPARFTEDTLIKTLETTGLGRPATYASIMDNILSRAYITPDSSKSKGKMPHLVPTHKGEYVVDALRSMAFMNYSYTHGVEASFDAIAQNKMAYINIIRPVHRQIQSDIAERLHGESLVPRSECPGCKKPIIQKTSKSRTDNVFWVHVKKEDEEGCVKYVNDQSGIPAMPEKPATSSCPDCGNPIKRLFSKRSEGHFWVHLHDSDSRNCVHAYIGDKEGQPKLHEKPETVDCLVCQGAIKRLYSQKTESHFWVHVNDESPCNHKYIDDENGVPTYPNETG